MYYSISPVVDKLFKLSALYQLSSSYKQNERAVWLFQQLVDLVDPDTTVFSSFLDSHCYF